MAAPTNPTKTTLVTDALKVAGYSNPSATKITRGEDSTLEWVKNDIWNRIVQGGDTKLKTLQTSSVTTGIIGQRRYATPDDFDEPESITILDATHTGTVQSGTTSQYTLESGEDASEVDIVGKYSYFIAGTSEGQLRQNLTYSTSTYIATVDIDWDSSKEPVSGDTYWIIDDYHPINLQTQMDLDDVSTIESGMPDLASIFNSELYFDRSLDKTYGIRFRYYANLSLVDLSEGSTELITKIYRNWRVALLNGLVYRTLYEDDDTKYRDAISIYENSVMNLILKEAPSYGEFKGFRMGDGR